MGDQLTMNKISNASQQQYVTSHFHFIVSSPIGLTNVVKNPAPRPKNWKIVIPFARWAKGKSSTRKARDQISMSSSKLTVLSTLSLSCVGKETTYCK